MAQRPLARSASAHPAVTALICLAAAGCAAISLDAGITVESPALQPAAPPPEGKRLTELAASAFGTAKLTGAPEVSPVRPTHDNQWGDWMFCIRGSGGDQSLKYAVLIGHDAILDVRLSVLIDGCEQETYQPLAAAAPPVKAVGRAVTGK